MTLNPVFRNAIRPIFAAVFPPPFSPMSLFASGEKGGWYAPSDITTLFQDSAGTTPVVAPGDPVGLALDGSGNGLDASQSISAERPFYAIVPATGRRNLLSETGFTNLTSGTPGGGTWNGFSRIFSGGTQTLTANDASLGGSSLRVSVTAARHVWRNNSTTFPAGVTTIWSADIEVHSGSLTTRDVLFFPAISNPTANVLATYNGEAIALTAPLPAGRGLLAVRTTTASDTVVDFRLGVGVEANRTGDVTFRDPQLEFASSRSAYQRVELNGIDVRQNGVQSLGYLARTNVSQSLNATMPDLGTNATVATATESGVSILSGQTVGAGAYDILQGDQTFGHIVINRPLRLSEATNVMQYLAEKTP